MGTLKDGTGKGYLAKVGDNNKLRTYATTESEISYESEVNEQAYVLMAEATPGTTSTGVCSIVNDSTTTNLIIDKIILSTEENTSVTAMTNFGFWRNPTTNSGGVAATPVNLNFSSNLTADCTCLEDADGTTLTISGGDSIKTIRMSNASTLTIDFNSSLILGKSNTFAVKCKTDNADKKVRAAIYFYFHSILQSI